MIKKMFTWFHARIFVLILFTAFISFCNQAVLQDTEGTEGNGILATTTDNINASSQIPTGPIASIYVPTSGCEYPNDAINDEVNTLTPNMVWWKVPGATTYQYQVYKVITASGLLQRIYTSPYIPAETYHAGEGQSSRLPSGILTFGPWGQLGYKWMVRARIYTTSGAWSNYAWFTVVNY